MYRRALVTVILILSTLTCLRAQKLYIWCPEATEVKPHTGFLENQEVELTVFDGRVVPPNSKVECESTTIQQSLITYIQKMYPSCKITPSTEVNYYKPSAKGKLTIKIGIGAYQSGFGTDISVGIGSVGGRFSYGVFPKGQWNGLVSYYVQIFDNRKEPEKKFSKEISEVTSKSNMWGYKTAKSCLYSSYDKANQALLSFIEDRLME